MATPMNGSLLKGFDILHLFSAERPEITAAVVMAETGANMATAHRFLATLEEAGAIAPARRGVYRLGHLIADLGRLAEETNPLVRQIQPIVDHLAADLRESVMVCRMGRRGPISLAVAVADRPFTLGFRVGATLSLLQSAQGRLWLAHMPPEVRATALEGAPEPEGLATIRAEGVAQNHGSAEPDIGAVAVPVMGPRGMALSLSVFGPLSRIDAAFRAQALPRLRHTAAEIATRLR